MSETDDKSNDLPSPITGSYNYSSNTNKVRLTHCVVIGHCYISRCYIVSSCPCEPLLHCQQNLHGFDSIVDKPDLDATPLTKNTDRVKGDKPLENEETQSSVLQITEGSQEDDIVDILSTDEGKTDEAQLMSWSKR